MIARKVVRLFGWLFALIAGTIVLYNLYTLLMNNPLQRLLNFPVLFQAGMLLLFLVGLVISTQNEIVGGIFTAFSPLIYITVVSILAGHVLLQTVQLLMLIGGVFLLFSAEQS